MENPNISTMNVEKYRVSMETYGKRFGGEVYSVKVVNADPKYNEKKRMGMPVPERPIKMFIINRHNIVSVAADIDASGLPIVVMKDQKGVDIRCSITKPEFKEVSIATVREAIEAFENNSNPLFFEDCEKLTKEITALNVQERGRANDLSKEMAAQAVQISESINIMQEQSRRYYESMNQKDVDVTVTVTSN